VSWIGYIHRCRLPNIQVVETDEDRIHIKLNQNNHNHNIHIHSISSFLPSFLPSFVPPFCPPPLPAPYFPTQISKNGPDRQIKSTPPIPLIPRPRRGPQRPLIRLLVRVDVPVRLEAPLVLARALPPRPHVPEGGVHGGGDGERGEGDVAGAAGHTTKPRVSKYIGYGYVGREREGGGRDRETVTRAPDGGLAAVGVCAASCDGHCISCLDSLGLFFFSIILFMN